MNCLSSITGIGALDFVLYLLVVLLLFFPICFVVQRLGAKHWWYFAASCAVTFTLTPVFFEFGPWPRYSLLDLGCGFVRINDQLTALGWQHIAAEVAFTSAVGAFTGWLLWLVAFRDAQPAVPAEVVASRRPG